MLDVQSEARRLTDRFRGASRHGHLYGQKATLRWQDHSLMMVLEGTVLRQRFLASGARQTVAVYFRDDVVNLARYAGHFDRKGDHLQALAGAVIGTVPDATVALLRAEAPGEDDVAALAYRETEIAQERLLSLGQRNAAQSLAHFFCETVIRCTAGTKSGRTDRCVMPLSQELLASVLGLSIVHVNRTMGRLRAMGLVDIVHHELIVKDFDGLAALAEFDETYLAPL